MTSYEDAGITINGDIKALKDNYQAAITRLTAIRDTATGMNVSQALQAISDMAKYQVQLLKFLKKVLVD